MAWKERLDKLGGVGAFTAEACSLGLPAIVAVFAALGSRFSSMTQYYCCCCYSCAAWRFLVCCMDRKNFESRGHWPWAP